MNNLIERYIYDVTRKLPEKDREEVEKELQANIYDMLSENPSEEEIKKVLYTLGSPVLLAAKYRTTPKYLISPDVYDEYVSTLKKVVPIVVTVAVVCGAIMGVFELLAISNPSVGDLFSNIISKAISFGISGVFYSFVFITIGFVIADRNKNNSKWASFITGESEEKTKKNSPQEWSVDDLPLIEKENKYKISIGESIIEIILIAVFSLIGILFCLKIISLSTGLTHNGKEITDIFTDGFLLRCIPAIIIMLVFGIIEFVAKIKDRQWSFFVCITSIMTSIVSAGITIYLIYQSNIFTNQFIEFTNSFASNAGNSDILQLLTTDKSHLIPLILTVLIVIGTIIGCGTTLYKTWRNNI